MHAIARVVVFAATIDIRACVMCQSGKYGFFDIDISQDGMSHFDLKTRSLSYWEIIDLYQEQVHKFNAIWTKSIFFTNWKNAIIKKTVSHASPWISMSSVE